MEAPSVYCGEVVHERLRPKRHKLRYRVFSMLVDLDRLAEISKRLRWFGHNRFNLFSFHDRDHGPGTAQNLAGHIRGLLAEAELTPFGHRILLLSYPRMLGYVFNPLSVYFCLNSAGQLGAIGYEVNNTFHERKTYLLAVDTASGDNLYQTCDKSFYVSPFNTGHGAYSFHIQPPGERVSIGVALRDDQQEPLMRAHFVGVQERVTDRTLLRLALRYPLMTLKVIGGIHLEALRLWWKGVPLARRQPGPRYSVDFVSFGASSAEPLALNDGAL